MENDTDKADSIAISEAQLILAEKRTSLAEMRTGIAVLVLPLSVISFLIATSKHYNALDVIYLLVPLGLLCLTLFFFGGYLIIRSITRMRHYDSLVHEIKSKHSFIGAFMD